MSRVVLALLALGLAGCGGEPAPVSLPLAPPTQEQAAGPGEAPPAAAPPVPAPSFEDDPAVQALRAYLAASAEAVNAGDLALPEFAALATTQRRDRHPDLYAEDLGTYFPGPPPTAVLGVQQDGPSLRTVRTCVLDDGFALDRPGGDPTEPRAVVPGYFEMVQEDGGWKVARAVADPESSCEGVVLPGDPGEGAA